MEHTHPVEADQGSLISAIRVDTIEAMLLERVRTTIDRHRMFDSGGTVLVAVSGGLDSVVLLDLLSRLAPDYGISLHVAHLDHGLRPASADDARFVERLSADLDLPSRIDRLDPDKFDARSGGVSEAAARAARHAFLESVRTEIGASRIALGHTADDQAETIIHRLTRGSGIKGLRGIPPVRLPFVRPLIETRRAEILEYARTRNLDWRVDASNADLSLTRNRIRHRVLPELERLNPKVVESICRSADLAAEADEIGDHLIRLLWDEVLANEGEERVAFRLGALNDLSRAVRKLLLREGARRVRGDLTGFEHDHTEEAARLAASESSHGELSLPGLSVRIQSDEVVLTRSAESPLAPWTYPVELGETAIVEPPIALRLEVVDGAPPRMNPSDRWIESADADRIHFPLELRSRRDGDRFTPLGLAKCVKLKDFLINEKIPYYDRDRVPLLCDREKIVWVVGVRLSDEVKITDSTCRILRMTARERR